MPLLTIGKVYHVSAFPNPGYKIKNVFVNTIDGQSHDITGHQMFRMQSDICGINAEFEPDNGEQPILGDDCYVYTTSDNQPLDIAICHWQSCINLGNGHGHGYTYQPSLIDYSVQPLNEGFSEFAGVMILNPFTGGYNGNSSHPDNLGPTTRHSYSYSDNVGIIQFTDVISIDEMTSQIVGTWIEKEDGYNEQWKFNNNGRGVSWNPSEGETEYTGHTFRWEIRDTSNQLQLWAQWYDGRIDYASKLFNIIYKLDECIIMEDMYGKKITLYKGISELYFGGTLDANGDYLRSGTRLVFSRNLKTIKFPDYIIGLYPEALRGCPNLEEVTFSGTEIWMGAFADCPKLKILRLTNQVPPIIQESDWAPMDIAIFENTPIEKIIVPNDQVMTYKQADGWIQFADKIVGDMEV